MAEKSLMGDMKKQDKIILLALIAIVFCYGIVLGASYAIQDDDEKEEDADG